MTRWRFWRRGGALRADASAFLDGELTPRERGDFEAELERSPELREYLDDLSIMRAELGVLREAQPRRSLELSGVDIAPQTPRLIAAPEAPAAPLRLRFAALGAAAAIAALAAVGLWDAFNLSGATVVERERAVETSATAPRPDRAVAVVQSQPEQ